MIFLLFKLHSFWIGIHYSEYHRRYCINILPCITICIVKKNGKIPENYNYKIR